MALPEPSATVAIKLASLAVHAEEALGAEGHKFDLVAVRSILSDPEVRAYLAELDAAALLPLKRAPDTGGGE